MSKSEATIDREEILDGYSYKRQVAVWPDELDKLESDYKDSLEAVDKMIIDRDAFHDKNVELEKKQNSINILQKLILKTAEEIGYNKGYKKAQADEQAEIEELKDLISEQNKQSIKINKSNRIMKDDIKELEQNELKLIDDLGFANNRAEGLQQRITDMEYKEKYH